MEEITAIKNHSKRSIHYHYPPAVFQNMLQKMKDSIQFIIRQEGEWQSMPYRWKTRIDVDEAIVVMMNVLDKNPDLPNWLIVTIIGSINDSDKKLVKYFFEEVKKNVPAALKYFESHQ